MSGTYLLRIFGLHRGDYNAGELHQAVEQGRIPEPLASAIGNEEGYWINRLDYLPPGETVRIMPGYRAQLVRADKAEGAC